MSTDSNVFTSSPGQWEPSLGDYLGDLADEVPDKKAPDNTITHFVAGVPKMTIIYPNPIKRAKLLFAMYEG